MAALITALVFTAAVAGGWLVFRFLDRHGPVWLGPAATTLFGIVFCVWNAVMQDWAAAVLGIVCAAFGAGGVVIRIHHGRDLG